MREDLNHLSAKQQDALRQEAQTLMQEFEKAIALGQNGKRSGKVRCLATFRTLTEIEESRVRSDWSRICCVIERRATFNQRYGAER